MWFLRYRKLCSVVCLLALLMSGMQWQLPRAEAVLPVVAGAAFVGAAQAGAVAIATQAGLRFATGTAARKAAQIWGSRVAASSAVTVQRIGTSPDVPGWVRYGLLGVLGVEGVQTALSIHDTVRASGTTGFEVNQRVDSQTLPYHIQQTSKTIPLVAFGNTFSWQLMEWGVYVFHVNGVMQGHGIGSETWEQLNASANGNVHRMNVAMWDETTVFFQYVFNDVDGNTWYGDNDCIRYGSLTDVVPGGMVEPATTWDVELLERLTDALQPQPRQVPNVHDPVFEINMPDIEALITQLGTLEAALAEAMNMMVAEPQKTIVTEFLGDPVLAPPPVIEGDFAGVISAILGLPAALSGFFTGIKNAVVAIPAAIATQLQVLFVPQANVQSRVEQLQSTFQGKQRMIGLPLPGDVPSGGGNLAPVWTMENLYTGSTMVLVDWADYQSMVDMFKRILGGVMIVITGIWAIRVWRPTPTID